MTLEHGIMVISNSGEFVSGSAFSNNANQTETTASATITADGAGTSLSENGTKTTTQINGDAITGTWTNPSQNNVRGTLSGSRN